MAYAVAIATVRTAYLIPEITMNKQAGMHNNRVIVVDHDESTTELIADLLQSEGLAPLCCPAWLLSEAAPCTF
jgi:hypothetical protein